MKRIREAWAAGGAKAGSEAVSPKLTDDLAYIGELGGAIERLKAQEEAGIDLHQVDVDSAGDTAAFERTVAALIG